MESSRVSGMKHRERGHKEDVSRGEVASFSFFLSFFMGRSGWVDRLQVYRNVRDERLSMNLSLEC